jgi:hypothetical protein
MRTRVADLLRAKVPLIPVTFSPRGQTPLLLRDPDQPPVDLLNPDAPDGWVNFYRQDDWSATAYFYLDKPVNGLPGLAPLSERIHDLHDVGNASARADG